MRKVENKSANDLFWRIQPLTMRGGVVSIRPVHTIPL